MKRLKALLFVFVMMTGVALDTSARAQFASSTPPPPPPPCTIVLSGAITATLSCSVSLASTEGSPQQTVFVMGSSQSQSSNNVATVTFAVNCSISVPGTIYPGTTISTSTAGVKAVCSVLQAQQGAAWLMAAGGAPSQPNQGTFSLTLTNAGGTVEEITSVQNYGPGQATYAGSNDPIKTVIPTVVSAGMIGTGRFMLSPMTGTAAANTVQVDLTFGGPTKPVIPPHKPVK